MSNEKMIDPDSTQSKVTQSNIITTTINREYAFRFLGVAILFIGLSGWFLFDGYFGYPNTNQAVEPITTTLSSQPLAAADWMNTAKTGKAPLIEAFDQAGIKTPSKYSDTFNSWIRAEDSRATSVEAAQAVLKEPVYSEEDIRAQFVSAAIGLLAALILLGILLLRFLTHFTLSDATLTVMFCHTARQYALAHLVTIDSSQWEKRGILKVRFTDGRITLDTWHHSGIREIAERLITLQPAPTEPMQ